MSEEQKKIKRYKISPVGLGEINIDTDDEGEFAYYEDVILNADQRSKVIRLCEKLIKRYEECHANNTSKGICSGCGYLLAKQLLEELKG